MVIDADKNFQFKGKGHEVSDFNRVMKTLKGWHFEAMPKIEILYFADRMQRVGNDKDVKQFLNKLRNVHKGLEILDDFQPNSIDEQVNQKISVNQHQNGPSSNGQMFEYINTSSGA